MSDQRFFEDLERERTQALVTRDTAAIERLHAEDYELITPAGRVFSRESYLSAIRSETFYAAWECGPMRVKVSDGIAVVRYHAQLRFPSGRIVDCWHTDIYEQRDSRWQAVWSQATGITPETSNRTPA